MAASRRSASALKAYVGHLSWTEEDAAPAPDGSRCTRLTCFAVAGSPDDAIESFYPLLRDHAKNAAIRAGVDIYLDDLSEIPIRSPMATLVFSAMTFGANLLGGVFATHGGDQVEHYEGPTTPGDLGPDGHPESFTPQPFAVVTKDGTLFRPT